MASTFCLVKPIADKFKQLIKDGSIDINKLSEMTSTERHSFFSNVMGDTSAKEVNALFESKLLLKNQKRGMVNWAKQLTGLKPEVQRDLIARIEKMETILSPAKQEEFLQELASKRLGTDISIEEANKIVELSKKVQDLKGYNTKQERIAYGRARLELSGYVSSLNPTKANLFTNISNVPRSLMASLDLSAPFNQGWGMLSRKQFYSSFKEMFSYLRSDSALLDLQADIVTRDTYKLAKSAGLRLTELGTNLEKREEVFMTNLLDKIPGVKGSQRAYTGFLNKLRMDVFDDVLKKAEIAGEDVSRGSKSLVDIANMVNAFTGGAKVGKIEGAVPFLNGLFFSPRKIKSTLDILNPVNYISKNISKTARIEATRNLVGSLAITTGVVGLFDVLGGDKITAETDPTSSDFGKLKVGNTRVDLSGGNANYVTLVSRILSQKKKSTTTGKDILLGTDFGQSSSFDLMTQFFRNKLSPNSSLIVDTLSGANSIGEKKTIPQSVVDRFKPMFISSVAELLKSDTNGKFLISAAALFGAGVDTYKPTLKPLKKLKAKK